MPNMKGISGVLGRYQTDTSQYFTSAVYPPLVKEAFKVNNPTVVSGASRSNTVESMSPSKNPLVLDGTLRDIVINYNKGIPDTFSIPNNPLVLNGTLVDVVKTYNTGKPDNFSIPNNPVVVGGTLVNVVINYQNGQPEGFKILTPSIISGTLV